MHEQLIDVLESLLGKGNEPDAITISAEAWGQVRDLVKQVVVELEFHGHLTLAQRVDREYSTVKDHVAIGGVGETVRDFAALVLRDAVAELRSTILALSRFEQQVQTQAEPPAQAPEPSPSRVLPERVAKVWQQYTIALQRGNWDHTPTDREAWDWCNYHLRLGAEMPNFLTWQRYLREARRFHGAQKNTPLSSKWFKYRMGG